MVLRLDGPRERTGIGPAFSVPFAGCLAVDKPLLSHASWRMVTPMSLTNEDVATEKE